MSNIRTSPAATRFLDRRGTAAIIGAPAILRGRFRLFAESPSEYSARAVRLVERTVVIDMLNQFRFRRLRRASAEERTLAAHAALVHRGRLPAIPHLGDPRVRARRRRAELRSRHSLVRRLERLHRRLHRLVHAHRERGRLRASEEVEQGGDHAHLPERRSFPHGRTTSTRFDRSASAPRSSPTTPPTGSARVFSPTPISDSRRSAPRSSRG